MRLSISNIAWDRSMDEDVAALLQDWNIDAVDVAPGKYFADLVGVGDAEILSVRDWWRSRDIEIVGMQSLLFGTTGLNIFNIGSHTELLRHFEAVCRIGDLLGARRLVFGSPRNRDKGNLSDTEVEDIGASIFTRLGDLCVKYGVVMCLEPNPERYGANFMTNCLETAAVVNRLGHPGIKMQFDTGSLTVNGEDPQEMLERYGNLIGHVHVSEPDLAVLGSSGARHDEMASALRCYLPNSILSIEMLTPKMRVIPSIRNALSIAVENYL